MTRKKGNTKNRPKCKYLSRKTSIIVNHLTCNRKKKGNNNSTTGQDSQQPNKFNKRQQKRPARQLARDFDSALADYEASQPSSIPPRQQQSYADLLDDYSNSNTNRRPQPSYANQYQQQSRPAYGQQQPSYNNSQPTYGQQLSYTNNQPVYGQPQQSQQGQQNYQSPADLVSALFQSYGGQLPTNLRAPAAAEAATTSTAQPATTTTNNSTYSLFSEPPPPLSELEIKKEQQ
jgi:hypothetical protein